jgi:hypothetical protein
MVAIMGSLGPVLCVDGGFVRRCLVVPLVVAQALLPVLGHAHPDPHHGIDTSHAGFHVHFDGSDHHRHRHDDHEKASEPAFSDEEEMRGAVAFLALAAWEATRTPGDTGESDAANVEFAPAVTRPWFEWPPDPVATPPTSGNLAPTIPIYLSLCSFRC